jgi:putative addiction module component (TIGR02574 family)
MTKIERLSAEVHKLPAVERAVLVEEILQSLDPIGRELEKQWTTEVQDRLAAYRRGELQARDIDDVLAAYGKP